MQQICGDDALVSECGSTQWFHFFLADRLDVLLLLCEREVRGIRLRDDDLESLLIRNRLLN